MRVSFPLLAEVFRPAKLEVVGITEIKPERLGGGGECALVVKGPDVPDSEYCTAEITNDEPFRRASRRTVKIKASS